MSDIDNFMRGSSSARGPICDDCLAQEAGWGQRQRANTIGRRLWDGRSIERGLGVCEKCGNTKTVNSIRLGSGLQSQPQPPGRMDSGGGETAPRRAVVSAEGSDKTFAVEMLRSWIEDIVNAHPVVMALACAQKAKFEGWLKFELAQRAVEAGTSLVELESGYESGERCDLCFEHESVQYAVELKTANMNYAIPGVIKRTRPVTKNIDGIAVDARKLRRFPAVGLVAFVVFPLRIGDNSWQAYLERIKSDGELGADSVASVSRCRVELAGGNRCDIAICVMSVAREGE
jgi:hypothetical protein